MRRLFYISFFIIIINDCQIIAPGRRINIAADRRTVTINDTIEFYNLNAKQSNLFWDFGDKQTGEGSRIGHNYDVPGIYWVKASFSKNFSAYKELKIIVRDEITNINEEDSIGEKQYHIILGETEINLDQLLRLSTDFPGPVEWDLGNGNKSNNKKAQVTYNSPGTKDILLLRKDNGEELARTTVLVVKYTRNYQSLNDLEIALNQIANEGLEREEKRELEKKIIEDCLEGNQTQVRGMNMIIYDYLKKLFIESSQYNQVNIKAEWEIDPNTNKILYLRVNHN